MVTLAAHSLSYFDQYMDEIVYYFEVSGRDIVIFEDIDRFEDVQIFETLRSLNTLLNGAEQVRFRKGHSARQQKNRASATPDVKFIYALRDSVFEQIGADSQEANLGDAAAEEVKRANRTKFFDLVIPIVPFITHRNARDLMIDEMEGTGVSSALTDLAARHIADKRLIVNMRNEYDMFANRLLGTENQIPGLDQDRMFAMILYKSVHMADFEAIRLGASKLDDLHIAWQRLFEYCVNDLTTRSLNLTSRIEAHDAVVTRSARLGERLKVIAKAAFPENIQQYSRVSVSDSTYGIAHLTIPELWYAIITEKKQIQITNSRNAGSRNLVFKDLQLVFGEDLDADKWQHEDHAELVREKSEIPDKISFLRHHTWQDIYDRPEFVGPDSEERSPESFRQLTERLLGSVLARELVANGYINDYFALYISIYYGRHLRHNALNFIVHALDQGKPHILYSLEPDDVKAILRDKGDGILRDRRVYNVSLLDHLLSTKDARAEMLIKQISAWGSIDQNFADWYLDVGAHKNEFAQALAPLRDEILTYLVGSARVDETQRVELVNAALGHLDSEREYFREGGVTRFVESHYTEFEVLTGNVPAKQTSRAMAMIATMGLRLPSVAPLNERGRQAAIADGTYLINEANLQSLTGRPSIALNELREANTDIYDTALSRLPTYIEAIREAASLQKTVTANDAFLGILHEAGEAAPNRDNAMVNLVHLAAEECRVDVLTDAPHWSWPALTASRRTNPTATNLVAYLGAFDGFDENIAALLADSEIVTHAEAVEGTDRIQLATAILNGRTHLPSATQCVCLAASLNLETLLDPEEITPEHGAFAGLLIERGIIADNPTTFSSQLIVDWETRQCAIEKSEAFGEFIGSDVLPAHDVGEFFNSPRVDAALKDSVLANISSYLADASTGTCNIVGRYAMQSQTVLDYDQIEAIRAGGAEYGILINLIAAASALPISELRSLLRSMNEPYSTIADHGTNRPLVPDDKAHRTILQRLKNAGIVSRFSEYKRQLRVSRHHR